MRMPGDEFYHGMTRSTDERSRDLAERLRERIRKDGPITFCDWMEAALYDPRDGYYSAKRRTRWGREGDYRTSAERSPLFAATFASWFARIYQECGAPAAWTIIEAGAGAGDFARVTLEALEQRHPAGFSAARYVVDEPSAASRGRVAGKLDRYRDRVEFKSISELGLSADLRIIFANELLDAFPVHRVRMRNGRLEELFVGISESGGFTLIEGVPSTERLQRQFDAAVVKLAEGQDAEVNLAAEDWLRDAARAIGHGYLVLVDYGDTASELYDPVRRPNGTLRAIRRHTVSADPFSMPGESDLTTTVNWTAIEACAARHDLELVLNEPQNTFLVEAGLLDQLELMSASAPSRQEALNLRVGAREMILPSYMSDAFQVAVFKKRDFGERLS